MKHGLAFMALIGVVVAGCVSASRLVQHPLDGQPVAVVMDIPEAPFVDFHMTIFDRVGNEAPPVLEHPPPTRAGAVVLDAIEAPPEPLPGPARQLIDSVLTVEPMSASIGTLVKTIGAQALQFTPVKPDEAAYEIRVTLDDYGLGADGESSPLYFELMGRIVLVDRVTGRRIWQEEIYDLVPVALALVSMGVVGEHTETPARLSELSFDEMQSVLRGLAAYAGHRVVAPLVEGYRKAPYRELARRL